MGGNIHRIDATIGIVCLVGITAIGIWSARKQAATSGGYFLAGRSLDWTTVGLALCAANISTPHLIGLASSGFSNGTVVGNFEWLAPPMLILPELLGLCYSIFA
jgi:SSS family solute:Na+ symporter